MAIHYIDTQHKVELYFSSIDPIARHARFRAKVLAPSVTGTPLEKYRYTDDLKSFKPFYSIYVELQCKNRYTLLFYRGTP